MFLLLLPLFLGLLYYIYIRPLRYWKVRNVPFEQPVPLFGNMLKATIRMEHMVETLSRLYNKYPDSRYFGLLNFQNPTLVIKDPELIKQVTVKEFETFPIHQALADNGNENSLWNKNLFSIQDMSRWRNMRATLSPSFTTSKMKFMYELMLECAKNFANYYTGQDREVFEIDVKDALRRYANDVIASAAFGLKVDSLNDPNNEFFRMGKKVGDFTGSRSIIFFLMTISPKLCKILNIDMFGKELSNFFRKTVKENIRIREEQNIFRNDMIQLLLDARKGKLKREKVEEKPEVGFAEVEESEMIQKESGYGIQITDDDITAQALVFFLAGFDSTSTMMSFAIAELAVNPEIQEKLADEVADIYEVTDGKPKYEDIQRMKYLDMVLSETMRKWNISAFMDRKLVKPYTIVGENGEPAVKLEKGDSIMIPGFSIHRDPKYFPDPEKFDPERFSDERKHEIKPFTYLPFGSGPRNCIGSRFALLESKVVLFYIMLNFEIFPSKKTKIPLTLDPSQLMLNIIGNFIFQFKKRSTAKSTKND